jgi:hypothetical protein
MPVNNTHPDYDASLPDWLRARDVLAGEDAVKSAGEKYLPRLDSQSDEEFLAYRKRASFFNATARSAEGFVGLIFRRPPFIKIPEVRAAPAIASTTQNAERKGPLTSALSPSDGARGTPNGVSRALAEFVNDADMQGTTFSGYAKNVVGEVVGIGRAGSLIDWCGGATSHRDGLSENRAYVSMYSAEQILNWRIERVNGRNVATLIVLSECVMQSGNSKVENRNSNSERRGGEPKLGMPPTPYLSGDEFESNSQQQIRVLRLVPGNGSPTRTGQDAGSESLLTSAATGHGEWQYEVEIWRPKENKRKSAKVEWELFETRVPLRLGKPLPLIPFVFHGPRHSRPDVDRGPLSDIIAVNLDHYRLDADYKHGLHFTALPTAWVSGFDKSASLRIGSSTAWVSETPGATAGYLEFTGQGLTSFERAMDRDERLMAVLGSRLLQDQKKVGETAEAIRLRQSGEDSALGAIATSVSESLTQVLRWIYWWNSTEALPYGLSKAEVTVKLNTDFGMAGMSSQDLQAVVGAWQSGAISRDTMFELFRSGEILPDGRTNQDEEMLIHTEGNKGNEVGQKPLMNGYVVCQRVPRKN